MLRLCVDFFRDLLFYWPMSFSRWLYFQFWAIWGMWNYADCVCARTTIVDDKMFTNIFRLPSKSVTSQFQIEKIDFRLTKRQCAFRVCINHGIALLSSAAFALKPNFTPRTDRIQLNDEHSRMHTRDTGIYIDHLLFFELWMECTVHSGASVVQHIYNICNLMSLHTLHSYRFCPIQSIFLFFICFVFFLNFISSIKTTLHMRIWL